jgi:hypothetical protein
MVGTQTGVASLRRRRRMAEDTVPLQSEQLSGEPLLECVMIGERRSHAAVPLAEIRQRAAADLCGYPCTCGPSTRQWRPMLPIRFALPTP